MIKNVHDYSDTITKTLQGHFTKSHSLRKFKVFFFVFFVLYFYYSCGAYV